MRYWLKAEQLKSVMIALLLLGIVTLLFGLYRFVSLSQAQTENPAYQVREQNSAVPLQSQTDAQLLMSADLELRDIQRQRNESAVFIGAGVALLAAGWLGSDVLRSRARRASSTA
jgi:hypothetical protein